MEESRVNRPAFVYVAGRARSSTCAHFFARAPMLIEQTSQESHGLVKTGACGGLNRGNNANTSAEPRWWFESEIARSKLAPLCLRFSL
jgi:hypothetical protein